MIKERFNRIYPIRVQQSDDFKNLQPMLTSAHELICCDAEEQEESLSCLRIIEQDLIGKGILSFKIMRYEDLNRINTDNLSGKIQWCIWSLISRMPKQD